MKERNEKRPCAGAKTERSTLRRAVRNRPLAAFVPTRRNNSRFTRNTTMTAAENSSYLSLFRRIILPAYKEGCEVFAI